MKACPCERERAEFIMTSARIENPLHLEHCA